MHRLYGVVFLTLATVVGVVVGYGQYRLQLPNGERVSHPCKANFIWRGVGHNNTRGGGSRNKFGLDFAANGYKWTLALCQLDSDKDSVTNGMELGDPNCTWRPGKIPNRTDDITHPGVCTPFDSSRCADQNDWIDCKGAVLECPAINNTDTKKLTLKLPRTRVPAKETTYMCMTFTLPSDTDYHMIAYEPEIDNDNVMHHILMYGCEYSDEPLSGEPYECDMNAGGKCTTLIGAWSLGEAGDCMDYKFGLLFGKSKFKRIALEYHWNNPKKVADWYDASGVSIYYTSSLRPNNGSVLTVGQTYLAIPPGRASTKFTATCSPACTTTALKTPIFVTIALNHMHYLGISQSVEQLRNGSRLRYVTKDDSFNYDDPQFYEFDPPIEVRPGDELLTTCEFKSTSSRDWVYYGDATSDEMCYAFMWFYPAESMLAPYCDNYKSIEICLGENKPLIVADCNVMDFLLVTSNDSYPIYEDVAVSCFAECTVECKAAVARAREHPCLRGGDITEYVERELKRDKEGRDFLQALADCGAERTTKRVSDNGSDASGLFTHQNLCLIMGAMYLMMEAVLFDY